jgi:hypothetical protein
MNSVKDLMYKDLIKLICYTELYNTTALQTSPYLENKLINKIWVGIGIQIQDHLQIQIENNFNEIIKKSNI